MTISNVDSESDIAFVWRTLVLDRNCMEVFGECGTGSNER